MTARHARRWCCPPRPAKGNTPGRRAVTLLFGTVAAAVAEKRRREGVKA
jgi:hypothetical protein